MRQLRCPSWPCLLRRPCSNRSAVLRQQRFSGLQGQLISALPVQLSGAAVAVIGGLVGFADADIRQDLLGIQTMAGEDLLVAALDAAIDGTGSGHAVDDQAEQAQDAPLKQPGGDRTGLAGCCRDRAQTPFLTSSWRRSHAVAERSRSNSTLLTRGRRDRLHRLARGCVGAWRRGLAVQH